MSGIDPDLGATWRAASSEQPPSALDDAIRAAARREVGAGPKRLRSAPRWWPLAAAATVAVVAVGIVQMTPPENVTPAAFPQATDAARQNAGAALPKPQENALKRDSVPVPQPSSAALPEAPKPSPKEPRARSGDEKNPSPASADDGFAAAPEAALQEKKSRLDAPAQRAEESRQLQQASKQKAELAAAAPAARPSSAVDSSAATATPGREPSAFPAAPARAEAEAKLATPPVIATAPAPQASGSASGGSAAPAPPRPVGGEARALAAQSSATSALTANAASSVGGRPPSAPVNDDAVARNSPALGKVTAAEADKVAPERRQDAAPLAPDEWIKRIRRLIAEGKNDDASKELADFRRAYKERSDALLPSDLRNFRR